MRIGCLLLILVLSGCTAKQRTPVPMPVPVLMADKDIDASTWHVINELVNSSYTWTTKEKDVFAY